MSSSINKICFFAGNFCPQDWAYCDGNNGMPNLSDLVFDTRNRPISSICCITNNEGEDAFIGQIVLTAFDFAPKNWAFCDGKIMSINNNVALFSVLDDKYGGDGINTFAIPNIKPVPNDEPNPSDKTTTMRYIICVQGRFPMRS